MLTQEQIKNLKPGDTLILNNYPISYLGTYTSGIIGALDDKAEACCYTRCHFPQQYLSLPPKHSPTRLFKEGDRVSPMFWNDRPPVAAEDSVNTEFMQEDGVYEVLADEKNSIVYIDYHGKRVFIPACHIELVTPVEEQESFGVRYSTDRGCAEVYHRRYKNTVAAFYCKCGITREQAEEHAEAEADRLNAEWRKEQDNG